MAAFVSREWIEQLDAAGVAVDPDVEFELEQVVTGSPYGDVRYRLTLRNGRLRARPEEPGAAAAPASGAPASGAPASRAPASDAPASGAPASDAPPDVVVTLSYATAVGLATGRLTGSDAFEEGLVRFNGRLGRLQDARAALAAAAEALAEAVPGTTYP
ncbi:MAG TPA: hypothetical protein VFA84_06730 [Acidimicrobiales bacterium]|nr:hypothetical protein [Acidimicrobiales bacterium]